MNRKPIYTKNRAINPVARTLWSAALEKLEEADLAIQQMENATDRIQYEAGWTRFVDSIEEFWTRFFDEGKSNFPNFQPWAGIIERNRKSDELLSYLYQARHQSQHGRIALIWQPPRLLIAPNFNGMIHQISIHPDKTYDINATSFQIGAPDATIEYDPGEAELPTIENKKFGNSFNPPITFQSQPLTDRSPINVAKIGVQFYRDVLKQAFEKFGTQ